MDMFFIPIWLIGKEAYHITFEHFKSMILQIDINIEQVLNFEAKLL